MQIHELFQRPKAVKEDLSSFFGLNNPAVSQVWSQLGGELIQDLSARFTKDPKYANMPLDQRKKAMMQDQNIKQIAQQKIDEWQKYITALATKNRGTPLTQQQQDAAFLNWVNSSVFGGKFNNLDPALKAKAQQIFGQIVAHQGDPDLNRRNSYQTDLLSTLIADETARAVQVATDLQKAQSAAGVATSTGQPTTQQPAQQPAQQGPGYTVQAAQPGYGAVKTNAPTITPQVNPQQLKQIAAKSAKAPA